MNEVRKTGLRGVSNALPTNHEILDRGGDLAQDCFEGAATDNEPSNSLGMQSVADAMKQNG